MMFDEITEEEVELALSVYSAGQHPAGTTVDIRMKAVLSSFLQRRRMAMVSRALGGGWVTKIKQAPPQRKLPERWEVGQRVRFVRDTDNFGPNKGNVGVISEVHPSYRNSPVGGYGVLWVKMDDGLFYTDFCDIELAD